MRSSWPVYPRYRNTMYNSFLNVLLLAVSYRKTFTFLTATNDIYFLPKIHILGKLALNAACQAIYIRQAFNFDPTNYVMSLKIRFSSYLSLCDEMPHKALCKFENGSFPFSRFFGMQNRTVLVCFALEIIVSRIRHVIK